MRCLNCKSPMTTNRVVMNQTEFSYEMCETCGSLWLDAGALDKIAFITEGSIEYCSQEETAVPVRECPRCEDHPLARVKFLGDSDIILDHCKNCDGFWLDGGELSLIDRELTRVMPEAGRSFSDFVNRVHVPWWHKRVSKVSAGGDNVQVEELPVAGATLQQTTEDVCPTCGHYLAVYALAPIEFEACPHCHGLWLEKQTLKELKNKESEGQLHWLNREVENIGRAAAVPSGRQCVKQPGQPMFSVVFGGSSVVIDWCPECDGIWMDGGDFDSIVRYLDEEARLATKDDLKREISADVDEGKIADASAAATALLNTTIFEHPRLVEFFNSLRVIG